MTTNQTFHTSGLLPGSGNSLVLNCSSQSNFIFNVRIPWSKSNLTLHASSMRAGNILATFLFWLCMVPGHDNVQGITHFCRAGKDSWSLSLCIPQYPPISWSFLLEGWLTWSRNVEEGTEFASLHSMFTHLQRPLADFSLLIHTVNWPSFVPIMRTKMVTISTYRTLVLCQALEH
jgi:hypothetical protein